MHRPASCLATVLLALVVAACAPAGDPAAGQATAEEATAEEAPTPPAAGEEPAEAVGAATFVVTTIGGQPVPADPPIEITVDGPTVSGSTPLNRFTGRVGEDGLGPLAVTRRAGPPEQMELETRFLQALDGATPDRPDASTLHFVRDGSPTLEAKIRKN